MGTVGIAHLRGFLVSKSLSSDVVNLNDILPEVTQVPTKQKD
ncbi:MAG: hypothetical protein ACTSUT_18305 [Promethearchaeota archaeon]